MSWTCAGCGAQVQGRELPFACPARDEGDVDHVLMRDSSPASPAEDHPNPFLAWRRRSYAWEVATAAGMPDAEFVTLVEALDGRVAEFSQSGAGFVRTPCAPTELAGCRVWIKDETGAVGGSHKARHLMGVAIYLDVMERLGWLEPGRPLAIASCGNAALAAALVARAAGRPLRVFIPPDARASVVKRLRALEAEIHICERQAGELGDPCYAAFRQAVVAGALPFCCQGPDCALTIEGGRTLAWELEASLREAGEELGHLFIQVGGGALLSAIGQGLKQGTLRPKVYAVQTAGCAPLPRAWERLRALPQGPEILSQARGKRSVFMTPWETTPASLAHGILDDETYDWAACLEVLQESGGGALVVSEEEVQEARRLGQATGVSAQAVSYTGAAGLAGLLAARAPGALAEGESVGVIFSGVRR